MENLPVFGSPEEYRMWRLLNEKATKKIVDSISTKVLASDGHVHPAILTALMEAKLRVYDEISISTIQSIVSKARPQDCSPAIKATELLVSKDEVTAAAEILARNESKDMFHRKLAEAELYHGEGDRINSVQSAKKGLEYDPACRRLYEILEEDDPDGPWLDMLSVQEAYEGKGDRVPVDPRMRELFSIYKYWFSGDKDSATDKLIHSKYYLDGDWEFILASARTSVDEKDWRSAKMMFDKIKDVGPPYVKYEAAEAFTMGRDPEQAQEIYDSLDQTSIRALQGRIAAYVQDGSEKDVMNAIYDYLDSEYVGTQDYAECIRMMMDTGRIDAARHILDMMETSNRRDPTYLVAYSNYLLERGDLRGARRISKEAVRHGGKDISVRILAARIKFSTGDVKGAEKDCDRILDSEPDNRDALVLKRDILVENNDVNTALDVCKRIMEKDPTDITTMMTLSGALSVKGDISGSMMMLRKVLSINPSRDNVLNVVGSMIESGMYREAVYLCYDLEKELPPDAMLRRLRGNAEYALGDYTKASVSYAAAAEVSPHDPVIWHSKGMADEARGDLDSAELSYNRAVLLDLNESEYWISKATIQEKFNDMFGAVESLNRAIELDPGSIYPMVRKAVILENAGRYEEALYFVDLCAVTEPDNVSVSLMRVRIMRESGSLEEAMLTAESIHNSIHSEDTALELAACYLAIGRRSDALKIIESALIGDEQSIRLRNALESIESGSEEISHSDLPKKEVQPTEEDADAAAKIAESMISMGDYKGAIMSIDQAMSLGGEEPKYILIKVGILLKLGETKEALDLVIDALKKHPKSAVLHEAMGDVKMAKSEYRGALQEYEKAMSLGLTISEILARKGDAQECLGYFDRSIDSYSMAVQRDPSDRDLRFKLSQKLYKRGYHARADSNLSELLGMYPEDVEAIILLARVRRDYRKDVGVTEAYKMFKACSITDQKYIDEMVEVLESAGHDDEARSLKKDDSGAASDTRVVRSVEKVLRRAYVSRTSPDDTDLLQSLGFEGKEAQEIIEYINKEVRYGEILPGSPDFQKMERASNEVMMKLNWKDPTKPIPLERAYVTGLFKDVDSTKRFISYVVKAATCDVNRDDMLKMVLDRVQGNTVFEIMRSCKVGVYQARQIQLLMGIQ